MVNLEALKCAIKDSGMTMTSVAVRSGIKRPTLYSKMNGVGEFTAGDIMGICEALRLNKTEREAIFFAKDVPK